MTRLWAMMLTLAFVAAAGGPFSAPAQAAPTVLNWSTYLRAGPGDGYGSIDELRHGVAVDLQACAGAWCKVSDGAAVGYVDKDALQIPATPEGAFRNSQSCFRSAQESYRGAALNRFCAAAPSAPAATRPPG